MKCWLGGLRSGAAVTVVITVQPTVAGLIRNYATTWSDVFDPVSTNNKTNAATRVE